VEKAALAAASVTLKFSLEIGNVDSEGLFTFTRYGE
jgi:hypothetical protein